ncbi:hypothetical protein NZ30_00555 [Xanthomonas translucens pv. undulosa]|nr:hypothetical protein FD63_00605 [Xanthomonas translucens pv. undulosa]AVY64922.1 hypothetical protein NZ30_00555 [Xanthomonas translucens pv. undulosa]
MIRGEHAQRKQISFSARFNKALLSLLIDGKQPCIKHCLSSHITGFSRLLQKCIWGKHVRFPLLLIGITMTIQPLLLRFTFRKGRIILKAQPFSCSRDFWKRMPD